MINLENDDDKLISESDSIVKSLNFQSPSLQQVYKISYLKKILESLKTLDFPSIYHQKNEQVLYYLGSLRDEIEKTDNKERKQELRNKLKSYEPPINVKFSISISYLLQESQNCGHDLGFINGLVYCFNGRYWENIPQELFMAFLTEVISKFGLNEFHSQKADTRKSLYKQFAASAFIPTETGEENEVEDNKVVINLKSQSFVCQKDNFEFRDFDKEDRLMYCLNFDYNPDAECNKFQKFLDTVLPDKDMQLLLAEYCAYILTKNLKLEKALILLGSGANGKSTFGDILTALLGGKKNVCYNSLSDLCDKSGYYRTGLSKYLLNFCSEFSTSYSPALLKQLISTEEVTARSLFKDPIVIQDYCKFIFNANVISKKDIEQSYGFHRRLIILPFIVTIPESERNPDLAKEIIRDELSGIFNWVLVGLKRILQNRRFTITPKIEAVRAQFEKESDSVALFIEECSYVRNSGEEYMVFKDLFEEYKGYCIDSLNMRTVSKPEFKRRLKDNLHFVIKENATNNATWVYCSKRPEEIESDGKMKSIEDNGEKLYFQDVRNFLNIKNDE